MSDKVLPKFDRELDWVRADSSSQSPGDSGFSVAEQLSSLLNLPEDLRGFLDAYEQHYGSRELRRSLREWLKQSELDLRPDASISPDPS